MDSRRRRPRRNRGATRRAARPRGAAGGDAPEERREAVRRGGDASHLGHGRPADAAPRSVAYEEDSRRSRPEETDPH